MITHSSDIRTPEINELKHLELLSNAAKAHQYFAQNPKEIDVMASKIVGAYKLTESERKERDDAIQAARDADKIAKDAQSALKSATEEAGQVRKDADIYAKGVKSEADQYKRTAFAEIKNEQALLEEKSKNLSEKESILLEEKNKINEFQKQIKLDLQKIADWKKEKEEWEQDYQHRLAALNDRMSRAVRG